MEVLRDFIVANSAQIWTLASVVVGGIVTYFSTSASESRKNKRQDQKENLERILIPCCTCLEQTVEQIGKIYQQPAELYTEQIFKEWLDVLDNPLVYLKAAKRVYLSQSMRKKLESYKATIEVFPDIIEQECTSYVVKYNNYLSDRLQKFPNVPMSMHITFSMKDDIKTKIKVALIKRTKLSLLESLVAVNFVRNDDPENFQQTTIQINDEARTIWGAIDYGVMDFTEVDDSDVKLACLLLKYIGENTSDEQKTLNQIINATKSSVILKNIIDGLNEMLNELVTDIDKITE